MIANFFNKTKPILAIIIGVLFLVYYVLAIVTVGNTVVTPDIVLSKAMYLFLFLILFFLVQFINRKNTLSKLNTYVLLILVILFGVFPQSMDVHQPFYAHLFLLLAFRKIYSLTINKSIKSKVFDSAFWIGVASIIYNFSFIFLLLLIVAIVFFKKQSIRNFVILIVGFLTPVYLVFTYYFFVDNMEGFYQLFSFHHSFSFEYITSTYSVWIAFMTLIFLLIGALFMIVLKINLLATTIRNSMMIIVTHLLISFLILIVAPIKTEVFLFLFFPSAIIIANFLEIIPNKKVKDFFLITFLLLSLIPYFL